MNQEKIGKFIAECRKEKNLTQLQLAEKLLQPASVSPNHPKCPHPSKKPPYLKSPPPLKA